MQVQNEFIEINENEIKNVDGGMWAWTPAAVMAGTLAALNGAYNAGKDFGSDFLYKWIYG